MSLGESMKSARHLPLRQNAARGGGGQGGDQVEWQGATELQVLLRDKMTKLANKLDGS